MASHIHHLRDLYMPPGLTEIRVERQGTIYTKKVRSVSEPNTAGRLLAAWEVLRGRAYAFEWPKAGDLEKIVESQS